MRRTAEDAAFTRTALLESALEIFGHQGWQGASFTSVAERAGVTRGAVHHHFASKTNLLEEALAWGWGEYGARLFDGGRATGPGEVLSQFVRLLRGDKVFRGLAATTVLVAPHVLSDVSEKNTALDAWRDRLAPPPPGAEEALATAVANIAIVLIEGLTVTAAMRPDDLPDPDDLPATLAALAQGLYPGRES